MNKWERKPILDDIDMTILLLISFQGNTVGYIKAVLDMPKQTVHNRLLKLVGAGVVCQQATYHRYNLTDEGWGIINNTRMQANIMLLASHFLRDSQEKAKLDHELQQSSQTSCINTEK